MKRIAGIFFFALYIMAATEAKQLLKFPVLIEHYTEHKQTDNTISFFDFMYMHYAGNDFNDRDQDRDMQLPFKSFSCIECDIPAFNPIATTINLKPIALEYEKPVFTGIFNFSSSYLSSIWQPPKTC